MGKRLARWALARDYGYDDLVFSGPVFKSHVAEGNSVIVSFRYTADSLTSMGHPLTGFELAGEDEVYYPATAVIEGDQVIVTSSAVDVPVAVRFGWSAIAQPNLFNSAGLPASPFRSDNWKRLSE